YFGDVAVALRATRTLRTAKRLQHLWWHACRVRNLCSPAGTAAATFCSGTRVACGKGAPTLQFAVIFTDRSALNRSSSQYERAFSVRFLLDHEMQTRRRANQGARESGATRGVRV